MEKPKDLISTQLTHANWEEELHIEQNNVNKSTNIKFENQSNSGPLYKRCTTLRRKNKINHGLQGNTKIYFN